MSGPPVRGSAVRAEAFVGEAAEGPPSRRRPGGAVALAAGAVALVALVAALSGGLPGRVHGGGGGGLSSGALARDAGAVLVVLALAGLVVLAYDEWAARRGRRRRMLALVWPRLRRPTLDAQLLAPPLVLAAAAGLLLGIVALLAGGHPHPRTLLRSAPGAVALPSLPHAARGGGSGAIALDPLALIITAALVIALAGVLALRARRRARRAAAAEDPGAGALVAALDDSLEDLAAEPDPRRAVIRAYERMERALAASGAPRALAETPVEYLRRALEAVRASQGSIRRLTDLFEQARFSAHRIDIAMQREAIAALGALRAELDGQGAR